ncbi:F-actin-capping protein subunit alpha [Coelomomyces lativittatus]|nr:F-actin-capping protein subunit alpha [Coelomomyces lativittatus]
MSSPTADMLNLVKRLEAVTAKLEDHVKNGSSSTSSPPLQMPSTNSIISSKYISQLQDPLNNFLRLSEEIGGPVKEQCMLVQKLVEIQSQIIQMASTSKKPEGGQLSNLMMPLSKVIEEIIMFKDKNRASPLVNHLTSVADGIPAFGWVVVEPTPAPYVSEMKDSAQFYGNRVIKQYKDKEPVHLEWVNSYSQFLSALYNYVKEEHTTGLRWNPKGGAVASNSIHPPPPPPPPPAPQSTPSSSGVASDFSAVFNQLNIGEKVTAGLRKVDPSEMTHKNPNLRAQGVTPTKENSITVRVPTTTKSAPKMEPKTYFELNRWNIENYTHRQDLEITQADIKQAVYIFGCVDCVIQVKGKVKSVTLDKCKKTAVIVDSLVTSLDVVNSQSTKLQVNGSVPTICIDKSDGVQVYLFKDALSSEIYTAKSTEVNVIMPSEKDELDSVEKPIPDQIKTTICPQKRNLISVPVEHKG